MTGVLNDDAALARKFYINEAVDWMSVYEPKSGQYGVSRERVRQIEVRAFEKLQKAMRAAAEERNLVDA